MAAELKIVIKDESAGSGGSTGQPSRAPSTNPSAPSSPNRFSAPPVAPAGSAYAAIGGTRYANLSSPSPAGSGSTPRDPAEVRRQKRIARGQAWKKNKRRAAWAERLAQKEKEAEEARAESEKGENEAESRRQSRVKRGLAWRKNKRREAWAARIKDREKEREEAEAEQANRGRNLRNAAAGAAASLIRGGGIGQTIGGSIGTAVGARYGGSAGAAIGSAVGEKAGAFADNPTKGAAEFGVKVAQGDGFGAMKDAADKAAMGLLLIPGPGTVAAIALKGITSAADSAREVLGAFAARGRELSGYSGEIATSAAMQDVTRTLTDLREGQMMGDKYAKALDAQTRLEETLKAGLLPLKEWILEKLPPIMDMILSFMDSLVQIGYAIPGVKDDFVTKVLTEMWAMRRALEGGDMVGGADMVRKWVGDGARLERFPIGDRADGMGRLPFGVPLIPPP